MPPHQCPECGRFLKNAVVADLARAPAPCPACEVELTPAMFGLQPAMPSPTGPATVPPPTPQPVAAASPPSPSIRPPDLQPEAVRDRDDPLAGWDAGIAAPEVVDQRPFPTDLVVVVAGAVAGAVTGTLAAERRGRAGALGAVAGALAAGAVRRIWALPDA